MSKRDTAEAMKDGHSIFITDLRQLGYLPEAVVNWIALMGWSYDDHTEFFTMDDLIEKFSLDKLNPSPAAINFTKLDHFNGLHIRSLVCGRPGAAHSARSWSRPATRWTKRSCSRSPR